MLLLFYEFVLILICNIFLLMSIERECFFPEIDLAIKVIGSLEFRRPSFELLHVISMFLLCTQVSIGARGSLSIQAIL